MTRSLQSSLYGELEYNDQDVYHFEDGVPGFPHLREFLLITVEESPFTVMHAINEDTSFFLINPFTRYEGYEVQIPNAAKQQLKIENLEDVVLYSIVVLREPLEDSTTNLAAPVILNTKEKLGAQVSLDNPQFSIRTPLFENVPQVSVGKEGK